MPNVSVDLPVAPREVVDVIDVLQVHPDPLEAVGDLCRDRCEVDATRLLKVGELRDLLAVEQHLPADPPGPQRRRFPVVLFETNVVTRRIDADRLQALQVLPLSVCRRRLEDHLQLKMLVEAVGIVAVAPVGGSPRRLNVGHRPWLRPEDAKEGLGMHRPGPHFDVERLLDQTPPLGPELLKHEDDLLKGHRFCATSRMTRGDFSSRSR